MQRLCFCFRCGKCSCIVCEGEERNQKEEKTTHATLIHKNHIKTITTCTQTCAKMANMDIHSNAPFVASSSSIRSTPIMESQPTLEDIQIAYQKLQSLISDPLVKFSIPKGASTKYSSIYSQASRNTSTSSGYERQRSLGSYLTPNKIAYNGPSSIGSITPTLSNPQDGPCLATLQDLIRKMSKEKTPPIIQECSMIDESTKRLMSKLKNLDEILQNLDNSLLCRKNSNKLFEPRMGENHSISNLKLSDNFYSTSKHVSANNVRLLSTDGGLAFATPPHSTTTMCNLELNKKPSLDSRGGTNLVVDKSWSESRSSESTQVLQSFATPVTTKETQDIPLLLSKFASYENKTSKNLWNDEKAMKEVVQTIVEQVEQQMLRRMRCLQRGPWRRVNIVLP